MSVNWQDDSSPARLKAYAAACESGEFDYTVPTWDIYCDLREALIWSLLITGFPARSEWSITVNNWEEVYRRLHILERVTGCRRVYNNGNRKTRKMFFTPEEIKSMIGLSVNAGNKSDAEFRKWVMGKLTESAETDLDIFLRPPQRYIDDPYYWENLHAPKDDSAS